MATIQGDEIMKHDSFHVSVFKPVSSYETW